MNVNVWVQHFNAVRAPLKHSEYLQGTNGDQVDHICSCKKQSERPKSKALRVAVEWPCPKQFLVKFAGTVWYECNILMQCAPLWNILNIYREWMGTRWPFALLQEAIRTTKSLWELQWVGLAPQTFACKMFGNSLVHFNAVRAPLNHSQYLQGMNGHQLTICAVARSNQTGQSLKLWELQWVSHAPQVFPSKVCKTVWYCMQMNSWMLTFGCDISMQCAPLWNILNIYKEWMGFKLTINVQLQEAVRTAKVFESCSGFGLVPQAFPCNICGNRLVEHVECFSSTFQCSARPFKTFWMFTKNEWGPADHMRSCKKQSERPKSLTVAVGWPCTPSVSL